MFHKYKLIKFQNQKKKSNFYDRSCPISAGQAACVILLVWSADFGVRCVFVFAGMALWGVWSREGHIRRDAVMVVSWEFNQCSCLSVTSLLLQPWGESSCTTNKTYQIPLFFPFSLFRLFLQQPVSLIDAVQCRIFLPLVRSPVRIVGTAAEHPVPVWGCLRQTRRTPMAQITPSPWPIWPWTISYSL